MVLQKLNRTAVLTNIGIFFFVSFVPLWSIYTFYEFININRIWE